MTCAKCSLTRFFLFFTLMTDLSPLEYEKVEYTNRKSMFDFLFECICNVCPICYRLWEICNRNMYDIDIGHKNGPRSNVNVLTESQCRNFHLIATVMFTSFTTYLQLNYAWPWPLGSTKVKCKLCQSSQCRTFYLMVIVMFAVSVTIYEIYTIEICARLTFRMSQGQI